MYISEWRFNEWQAVSLYLTDLLLFALLLFWFFSVIRTGQISNFKFLISKQFQNLKPQFQKPDFYLILLIIISAVSIKNSDDLVISWYRWLKLVEFSILYWYLSTYALKKFGLFHTFLVIAFSGLLQAIVGIIQFSRQSSIGLKYFGESLINTDLPGIASFYVTGGARVIRAYGTAPHPNVLATFFLLSIFAFYFVYLYSRLHSEHPPFKDWWDKFMLASYCVTLFAFFATFSRTVIFIWLALFCIRVAIIFSVKHYRAVFGTKVGKVRLRAILIAGFAVIVLFSGLYYEEIISRLTISGEDQSVQLRAFYTKQALSWDINYFGVGIGNFINWMVHKNPSLPFHAYQPVHNIYLLIYSEIGIFGLVAFLGFLFFVLKDFVSRTKLKKSYNFSLLFLFISLIFVGFFDHMFMTLQQGSLIFWITLGVLTFSSKGDILK